MYWVQTEDGGYVNLEHASRLVVRRGLTVAQHRSHALIAEFPVHLGEGQLVEVWIATGDYPDPLQQRLDALIADLNAHQQGNPGS